MRRPIGIRLAACILSAVVFLSVDYSLRAEPSDDSALRALVPDIQREDIDRDQLLDNLLARLSMTTNPRTATILESAIWAFWLRSESPTIEVLMKQSARAMKDGAHDAALTILDTVIELAPDYAEAWNRRATVYFLEGRYRRSLADLERVLDLEPRHFGALTALGMVRRQMGDRAGAIEAFERALEIAPLLENARRALRAIRPEREGQDI